MNAIKQFSAFLLMLTLFAACKTKSPKELVVGKWKMKDISGGDAAQIPDSVKARMISTSVMEFMADNKYSLSGMDAGAQTGTYSLSDDGKMLSITPDASKIKEVDTIKELTEGTMVVVDKSGTRLTCSH